MGSGDQSEARVVMVVGVDGAGRTHRLHALAAADGRPVLRVQGPGMQPTELRNQLESNSSAAVLVLVDDAHRLPGPVLLVLAEAARAGRPMLATRRPTIDRPELAELDEALAAAGLIEVLRALDPEQTADLVAAVTGRACGPEAGLVVWRASGGLPGLVAAVASASASGSASGSPSGSGADPAPALAARLQRRLAVLGPDHTRAARVLALRLDLPDDVLAAACELTPDGVEAALAALRDEGLLMPGGEQMVPAVAEALLSELTGGQRRRVHDDVARALVATGSAAVPAATQLRAARARGSLAALAYLAAGEQLRFTDPAVALGWYDDAEDAGAAPDQLVPGRAEAGALLGMPVDPDAGGLSGPAATRLALAAGAVAAHEGRAGRAASALLAAGPPGPALAVPVLVAVGRLGEAEVAARTSAPEAIRLLAAAALAGTDPLEALAPVIEAAEASERTQPGAVLPDTPHAIGAVLAVAAGDVPTAVHLLTRALEHGVGGPVARERHHLLSAWARMRAGQLEPAREQARSLVEADLGGRDRVLHAALVAGLARRRGDIPALRAAWPAVERVLARRGLDLLQVEAAEELAVAAARLRRPARMAPTLATFAAIVAGLGSPPAWVVTLGWLHMQVAVAADDPVAAADAAATITTARPGGARPLAQQAAAGPWAAALAGDVDAEAVIAAADGLADVEMPWEAARLAGDAAIRTTDAGAARRLLERARDLAGPESASASGPGGRSTDPAQQAGLSEREVEVATLVLAGRTHREIGAQLFIAPKTVEHHVARIRTKLGVSNRAEFVAALRTLVDPGGAPP